MEKALEILNQQLRDETLWLDSHDEAIKELEEAMKPKTCGECAAYDKDGNCKEGVRISNVQGVPSSFYCKWHEPEDNA